MTGWWEKMIDSGCLDWIWEGELAAKHGYSNDELAIVARVLALPCPTCQSVPGEWCRSTRGGEILDHLDRQHLARRLGS
jgi:hypothetical protein